MANNGWDRIGLQYGETVEPKIALGAFGDFVKAQFVGIKVYSCVDILCQSSFLTK